MYLSEVVKFCILKEFTLEYGAEISDTNANPIQY